MVCCDGLSEAVAATWANAWNRFAPVLASPPRLGKVIYTANSIESLNYQLRKATTNWKQALVQLAAAYPERINPYL